MIEVIDQYGGRHRFDDRHFFDRYEDRVEVMLEESDEIECVATFPHPATFGKVSENDCLSLHEMPPGIARQIAESEALIEKMYGALTQANECCYCDKVTDEAVAAYKEWKKRAPNLHQTPP